MLNRTSAILCKVIVFSASVLFLASGAALAQSVQADSYQGTSFTIATARMGALSTDGGKYSGTPPGTWPLPGNSSSPCGAGQWEFRYEVSFTGVLTPLVPVPNLAYIGMNIPACISPTAITCKSLSCSTGQPGVTPSCLGADPTQNYWRFVNPNNQGGYVLAAAKGASYFLYGVFAISKFR